MVVWVGWMGSGWRGCCCGGWIVGKGVCVERVLAGLVRVRECWQGGECEGDGVLAVRVRVMEWWQCV